MEVDLENRAKVLWKIFGHRHSLAERDRQMSSFLEGYLW